MKDIVIAEKPGGYSSIDGRSAEIKFIDASMYLIRLIDLLTNITLEDDL